MTCWKTINLNKDYGLHRVTMLSLLLTVFVFIILYLPMNIIHHNPQLHDEGFFIFLLGLLLLAPIHQLLHVIPAVLFLKKVTFVKCKNQKLPRFKIVKPLSKYISLIVFSFPFVTVTASLIIASLYFPEYFHYFTIACSIHVGMCVTDLLYLLHTIKAPRASRIEEVDDGFEIIIEQTT
ncbi:DUF3267 domain-containing protein [Bacillus sp. HMF5848]|uniref:DUF3267 domain-containing protein n=1 Tax=Bacillus sp. HMF5848 TaxID=2495421 RepID=UPI000F79EB19|nr:DUF3267 domain-containing protein [Bacillus sp. HMF5848]RSK26321.1 DUF3267 domain-containing protein [Bacillus sp. HMF5848]